MTPSAPSPRGGVARTVVVASLCVLAAACGSVNADSGRLATDRFALPDRGRPPPGRAVPSPTEFGVVPEQLTGTVNYLGATTDMTGSGAVVVGPGPVPGGIVVTRYRLPSEFPYETIAITSTDRGSFLTSIEVVNPLDSRIALRCTVVGGIELDPGPEPRQDAGTCAGDATLHATTRVARTRTARWQGRTMRLLTTQTDLELSGPIRGTLRETNDLPDDLQSMALATVLDVDVEQSGNRFQEHLERQVLPLVQEVGP